MKIDSISEHALMRWRQRFAHRFPLGLHAEFHHSRRWKQRRLIAIGVRYDPKYRYYCTKLCIFIVRSENNCLITVMERKR
ncbi:hypothetical protein SBVc24_0067 [Vibrio phage 24]|nr:hypothetical protein SBVc24_0067 [Vibrio phage 24]